nr:ATP-binding protein [Bdellovibrio bacteriovorus]
MDFVGNASHELRTPLTSIKGYVDTLKEDVKTGQIQQAGKFLDIVSRNIDRLMDLVNDMLSINTLEASNSELKLEMIHPLAISEHVVSELAVMAAEKNITIRVNGDVPPFLADARKVEQVLRNLVSNAVKYIPSGKTIQIRWERDIKEYIILRVIDDGQGIPEQHLDRLFERFYRIDKGRTRDAGGTGLGLAIVKHIMQSHGGTVAVKSIVDQGSEFICSFPIRK